MHVYIMNGLPGSGKSTAADEIIKKFSESKIIRLDDIRYDIIGDDYDEDYEPLVWIKALDLLEEEIEAHHSESSFALIIDECNLNRDFINMWKLHSIDNFNRFKREHDCLAIHVESMKTSVDECKSRRGAGWSEIIDRKASKYEMCKNSIEIYV